MLKYQNSSFTCGIMIDNIKNRTRKDELKDFLFVLMRLLIKGNNSIQVKNANNDLHKG